MHSAPAGKGLPTIPEAWQLILEKVQDWSEAIISSLPNLLVALVVLILFLLAGKLTQKAVRSTLNRTRMHLPLAKFLSGTANFAIVLFGIFVALGILGLDKTVTSLLAGVGIVGLALGFAFQEIASNFIAGIILLLRRPFRLGDLVEIGDQMGLVADVNLRTTILTLLTGPAVRVPNSSVLNSPIINYTVNGRRRIDLPISVTYGEDLEQVRNVTTTALEPLPGRWRERDVEVFFTEFGESSINMIARFWIERTAQNEWLLARNDAIMAVKKAFDANQITIPFPIRTLDFSTVGGRTLTQALDERKG